MTVSVCGCFKVDEYVHPVFVILHLVKFSFISKFVIELNIYLNFLMFTGYDACFKPVVLKLFSLRRLWKVCWACDTPAV